MEQPALRIADCDVSWNGMFSFRSSICRALIKKTSTITVRITARGNQRFKKLNSTFWSRDQDFYVGSEWEAWCGAQRRSLCWWVEVPCFDSGNDRNSTSLDFTASSRVQNRRRFSENDRRKLFAVWDKIVKTKRFEKKRPPIRASGCLSIVSKHFCHRECVLYYSCITLVELFAILKVVATYNRKGKVTSNLVSLISLRFM